MNSSPKARRISASSCRAACTTPRCARSNCSGLSDAFGDSQVPLYVLNVTYPLVDDEVTRFCAGKRAVLVIEEGQPDFIEQNLHCHPAQGGYANQSARQRRAADGGRVHGRGGDRRAC